MPDSTRPPPQRISARDAFAALSLEQPPHTVWPALAARVRRRPRAGRAALWWAVAASVVLVAIGLPRLAPPDAAPTSAPAAASSVATGNDAGLDALVAQSQALESRIQRMPPALRSGSAVLAGEWITADIGAIDAALAEARPEDAATLWQARLVLLAELAGLRQREAVTASGAARLFVALD